MHVLTSPLPRLVVAGTNSGSGKTTLSMALLAAFAQRGLHPIPFKCGPDYIDPAFLQAAAGTECTNLDAWLMPEEALVHGFVRRMEKSANLPGEAPALIALIALIEGVMGYFDGLGHSSRCSTAHIAHILDAPVLLVLNAQGLSLSAAAMVQGFAAFQPEESGHAPHISPRIQGVVCNHVSGKAHYDLLQKAIAEHCGIPCFGYLPKETLEPLPARHLGLVPAEETHSLPARLAALLDQAKQSLDLDGILALARSAKPLQRPKTPGLPAPDLPDPGLPAPGLPAPGLPEELYTQDAPPPSQPLTIGIARDKAFSFTYADNLAFLEECGAQLVFFSPLHDEKLPDSLDGLYLCGGFPEMFAQELEANASFRQSLHSALEAGLPAYAECGGMLYLCDSLQSASGCHAMTGFFRAKAHMTTRLQHFGYITLTLQQDCILGTAGDSFPAHEFHYSAICADVPAEAARMEKTTGKTWTGGLVKNRVFAMYPHVHFRGAPKAARAFVQACRDQQARQNTQHNQQGSR